MNQNNYHIKKRMSPIETALLGNLIYIVLVLILKNVLDLIGNDGNYKLWFGAIELVITAGYWIILNWFLFRNPASHQDGSYAKYIFFSLLPILVFTIIATVVIYTAPGTNFTSAWNEFTFLVAPTIFWFLPYGLIYHFIGSALPIVVYFGICLVLVVIFQSIGIAMGSGRRRKLRERAEKREREKEEKEKVSVEKVIEPYNKKRRPAASQQPAAQKPKKKAQPKPQPKKADPNDPFGDDDDQPQIIYTEAFSVITDEMLEEAERRKRENLEDKMAEAATPSGEAEEILDHVEKGLIDEIDTEAVNRAIAETQRGLKAAKQPRKAPREKDNVLDREKSETQDITAELEHIRKLMSQNDKNKRK